MLYDKERWEPKPQKLEPWQQCLLDAANRIRKKGWCQGMGVNRWGEMCALGAIGSIDASTTARTMAARMLVRYLNAPPYVGYPSVHIPAWNDASGRTKEEVIAALEGAAKG